jgi:Rhodopirellula transposase DDE domain
MLGFQGGVSIPLVKGGVKAPPAKRQCRAGPKAGARRGFTFIVDTIAAKWEAMAEQEKAETSLIQIKMDNGPESSGRRTQFLSRMVQLADLINKPIQLLYYPPYHSKYNPIERCWGILELQWNGTKLIDAETMLGWAKQMTWKGIHPIVALSHRVYQKGISLGKAAMQAVEARLQRDPNLPKYDIWINPAPTS